jgi:hypothetical protein
MHPAVQSGPLAVDAPARPAVDEDVAAGALPQLPRRHAVLRLRVGDAQRQVEVAVGVLAVDEVVALRRLPVALDLLRTHGREAEVDLVGLQRHVVVHEVHPPVLLVDKDARDLRSVVGLYFALGAAARQNRDHGEEEYRPDYLHVPARHLCLPGRYYG